eukprot:5533283-Amphidinium_carterae.1
MGLEPLAKPGRPYKARHDMSCLGTSGRHTARHNNATRSLCKICHDSAPRKKKNKHTQDRHVTTSLAVTVCILHTLRPPQV